MSLMRLLISIQGLNIQVMGFIPCMRPNFRPPKEAHFATFPPDLIKPCILAGCPAGGVVLDPFMGSGTTGMVAAMHQRNFIGFELNPKYCKMAEKRIEPYLMQQTTFEPLR
jgi:DNA modification methylase